MKLKDFLYKNKEGLFIGGGIGLLLSTVGASDLGCALFLPTNVCASNVTKIMLFAVVGAIMGLIGDLIYKSNR